MTVEYLGVTCDRCAGIGDLPGGEFCEKCGGVGTVPIRAYTPGISKNSLRTVGIVLLAIAAVVLFGMVVRP
jgi:hypothetical protein